MQQYFKDYKLSCVLLFRALLRTRCDAFYKMPLIVDSEFTLYLLCGYFIVCGHVWIPHVSRAYERYFAGWTEADLKHVAIWWLSVPPSVEALSLLIFLSNVCLAASSINYLYWNRNPATGEQQNYYVSIEALGMAVLATKLAWHYFLMTFYRRYWGLVAAMLSVAVLMLLLAGIIVLLGIRAQWFSFAFMCPVAAFYALCSSWTYTIWLQYQQIVAGVAHHHQ